MMAAVIATSYFARADAGQYAGPGQDFLFDLERRVLRKSFYEFIVETRLAFHL